MERQNYSLENRAISPDSIKAALVRRHPALENASVLRISNYVAAQNGALAAAPPGYVFALYLIEHDTNVGLTILPIGDLVEIHPAPPPAKGYAPEGVITPALAAQEKP